MLRIYSGVGPAERVQLSPTAWDGADDRGIRVASGMYMCRLQAEGAVESFNQVRAMIMLN